ncbi:MAG: TrmH family RNA methyltransferase [Bacilli bacterium]|nr:TrmH family RNA methyltransferase [Bacilli bacterium]
MARYKKEQPTSYALGTTLVFELLKRKPSLARRLYINSKQNRDETYASMLSIAKENHIPVSENNEKIFRELSEKENCMAIGEFEKKEESLSEKENHIVLVNPSNLGNLGTIMRSMVGFGFLNLAIIKPAADPFDPKTVRASMGAIFNLRVKRYECFADYEKEFPSHHLYPFMLQTKNSIKTVEKEAPFSLIFGNEATGLDHSFLEKGTPVLIPHSDLIDSLNLDNACSIAFYEFSR